MQKYLKMLEENVQWIALGLGGIYVLWMAYAYVVTPPVTAKLGTEVVTPEDVDTTILAKEGHKLETEMSRNDSIDIPVADVLAPYVAKIDEQNLNLPQLALNWGGTRGGVLGEADNTSNVDRIAIDKLPEPPAPVYKAESNDITTVLIPPPKGPGGAQLANNASANNGAQLLPLQRDTNWISLTFTIPADQLKQAWSAAFNNPNLPGIEQLFQTKFLQVELIRQEKLPDGKWGADGVEGKETVIKPIHAGDFPPYPGDVVTADDQRGRETATAYRLWADKAQGDLTSPAFFEVAPGTNKWFAPGTEKPDPNAKQGNNTPRRQLPPSRTGASGAVAPGTAPASPFFNQPGNPQPWANPGGNQGNGGNFNVANLNQDKEILVHDITAQDGHTYRYKLRYKLANPVWDSANLVSKKELASQYALVSKESDWSKEITIPSHTRLFVTNVLGNLSGSAGKATFDVFEWKDGKYNKSRVEATPGDAVKNWTVVDIRQDPGRRDYYVVLVDSNGNTVQHSKRDDANDPAYDQLKAATEAPAGPAARQQALAR